MFRSLVFLLAFKISLVYGIDKKPVELTLADIAEVTSVSLDDIRISLERDKGLFRGVEGKGYIFKAFYADDIVDTKVVKQLSEKIKPLLKKGLTFVISLYGYSSRKNTSYPGGKPGLAHARAKETKKYLQKFLTGENILIKVEGFDVIGPENRLLEYGKFQYVEARVHLNMPKGKDCNKTIRQDFQGAASTTEKTIHVGGSSQVILNFTSYFEPDSFQVKGILPFPINVSGDDYVDNYGVDAAVRFCYVESAKVKRNNDCRKLVIAMISAPVLNRESVKAILKGSLIPELEPVHDQFIGYLKFTNSEFKKFPGCLKSFTRIGAKNYSQLVWPTQFENGFMKFEIKSLCGKPYWKMRVECL